MRVHHKLAATAILAVTLLAAPATATAKTATPHHHPLLANVTNPPPAGFASWEAVFERQNLMMTALAAIEAAAPTSTDESGYSTAIADPTLPALTVYWHGTVPPAVSAAIQAERGNIPIDLLSAPYNKEQLAAETERIGGYPGIGAVAPKWDGTGLKVELPVGPESLAARDAAREWAERTSSVALTFIDATGNDVPFSRQADGSPYSAGARVGGGTCTAGFTVNWSGMTRMLYAAHCGAAGSDVVINGVVAGTVINVSSTRDTSMINTRGWGRMWDGGVQSTFYKRVARAEQSRNGNLTCTSGARSGVQCGIRIIDVDAKTPAGYFPMVRVQQVDHNAFAGHGDSGGPVFSVIGTDQVGAVGIIHGGLDSTKAPCPGDPTTATRWCAYEGWYASVTDALAWYGGSVVTE